MTLGELKEKIRDLGFEEDTTMREYTSIVVNAINRAVHIIYHTIVYPNRSYYIHVLEEEPDEPQNITLESKNTDDINLPDNVMELVPLLTAYYVWLDDDIVKATMYKNEYEDVKELIVGNMNTKPKLIFGEGLGF